MEKTISLVPVGKVKVQVLDYLKRELPLVFGREVKVKKPLHKPPQAYNQLRAQYLSTVFLEELLKEDFGTEKVLGITEEDLYVEGLNFVFGEAYIGGKVCVISCARPNPVFYGLPFNEKIFLQRVLKEAVHELGHTYGLSHCRDMRCVMHFSNTLSDTDVKEANFCAVCEKKLSAAKSRE